MMSIRVVLFVAIGVFVGVFLLEAWCLHQSFGTSAYDLGIFDQQFWLLSQGMRPFNTVRGLNLFGDHFSPIEILFAPLYRLWPSLMWPLTIQCLAIAMGAFLLYKIACEQSLRPQVALLLALAYLINPVVHNPLLWQYHTLVLVTPFYFCLLQSYFRDEIRKFSFYCLILLLIREDVPVTLLAFSVTAALQRRWRYVFVAVFLALPWWLIVTKFIMPYFNGTGYFRHKSGSLQGLWEHLLDWNYYRQRLFASESLLYVLWLFFPLLLIPFGSPAIMIPVLPTLLINVLIGAYNIQIKYHYSVNAIAFLFVGIVLTMKRFSIKSQNLFSIALVISCIFSAWKGSEFRLSRISEDIVRWQETDSLRKLVNHWSEKAGRESGIAASDFLLPHLSERKNIYLFPNPWKIHYWGIRGELPHDPNTVQWLFLNPEHIEENMNLISYLEKSGYFKKVLEEKKLWIYHRQLLEPEFRPSEEL